MRVLHSTLHLVQTWLYRSIASLPAEIDSHVVCMRHEDLHGFDLPELRSLRQASPYRYGIERVARRFGFRGLLRHVERVARELSPQLVHSHSASVAWADLDAVEALGVPHVVSCYGGGDLPGLARIRPAWLPRCREVFERATLVLCEGPAMGHSLLDLGCPERKMAVHRLGIAVDEIPFQLHRRSQGEPLGVLLCGLFAERKGFPDAIRAIGRVASSQDLRVTLIGDRRRFRDRGVRRKILRAIDESGLTACVQIMPFLSRHELARVAAAHHVFLSPSVTTASGDSEGGAPLAILEMAARGLPVVSTLHADIPNVLEDELEALLAPEGDVLGIADRLQRLAEDPKLSVDLARAARARVERDFDGRMRGHALAEIYASLVT